MSDQNPNPEPQSRLSPLEFSEPVQNEAKGYYETEAYHTNEQGYRFRIHVNCRDPHAIRRYRNSVFVSFVVAPLVAATEAAQNALQTSEAQAKQPTLASEESGDTTLDISIDADIDQPHKLSFTIDPDITTNEIHAYRFPDAVEGSVTVTAVGGSLSASFQGTTAQAPMQLDGDGQNNMPREHRFAEEISTGTTVIFSLSVTGKQIGSKYKLVGDVTRGQSGGPQGDKFDPGHSHLPPH